MQDRVKVKDEKNLVRDMNTSAILSLDKENLNISRNARRVRNADKAKIKSLEERLSILERELSRNVSKQN